MNEIRDLIIGIDFGKEVSQLCYYDRKAEEARSVSMKVGGNLYEAPTCLFYQEAQEEFRVGLEAQYFAREKEGILLNDLYGICEQEQAVDVAGRKREPWELLGIFLKGMLKFLGVIDLVKNTKCLAVSVPALAQTQVSNLQKALRLLGFPEEKYMLLDYEEGFYYYILTQQKDSWNRSVAWYAFSRDEVAFRRLVRNSNTRPVLVRLEEPRTASLRPEGEERDQDFYNFVRETLGSDLYSSIQITGEGFDQTWAKRSVKLLCYQKRKVFYGNNLFARGACVAAVEKLEKKALKDYRYYGAALVTSEIGMDMRVMGAPAYYPLIEAGNNWYECKARCELILDDVQELVFCISSFREPEKKRFSMSLPGLPKRPNRTTRLLLELQYISVRECSITVRDLGFGDMFPSSGKVWKEIARW